MLITAYALPSGLWITGIATGEEDFEGDNVWMLII